MSTIVVLGGFFGILLRGGWSWGEILEPDPMIFQNPLHMKAMTMAFAAIAVMQIANAFACRTEIKSAVSIGLTSNRLLISGIIFELVFIIMLINIPFLSNIFNLVPLGITEWTYLIFSMLAIFAIEEARKMYRRKRYTV